MDSLLTSRDVSELLSVSPATLSRWRDRGDGPRWLELSAGIPRYRPEDVTIWLEERSRG